MRSRAFLMVVCTVLTLTSAAPGLEFRVEPYRVGIVDVGEPILLDYPELTNEMNSNIELRDWIESYGRPEYAEYQKVALTDPFLPYEIRLYYVEGRKYVAFGRVSVSPALADFGVRKYIGNLDSHQLQRLLTARPLADAVKMAAAPALDVEAPIYRAPEPQQAAVETNGEEVVEIIAPEAVVGGAAVGEGNAADAEPAAEDEVIIEVDDSLPTQ